MLQKVDKDRLDKVLQVLESQNIRFINKVVTELTGEDKGNVSAYLSGKKPMPDKFYTTIIKKYGLKEESKPEPAGTPSAIDNLAKANLVLSESLLVGQHNNKDIIELLKFNLSALKETPKVSDYVGPVLDKIAQNGTGELWKSKDEGLLKLGKLIVGVEGVVKE